MPNDAPGDTGDLRGALVAISIEGIFGALWALWGSSVLPAPYSVIVALIGVVAGLWLMVGSIRIVRTLTDEPAPGSMVTNWRYRLIVVAEALLIVVGAVVLNLTRNGQYLAPWAALVVGLHFLLFARIFSPRFALLGWPLVGAAVLGTVLGLVFGGREVVVATTALISSAVLLGTGYRLLQSVSASRRAA
jgi:hypothetical protein